MAIHVHTPPYYRDIPLLEPTLFQAGPIQGAPDWQQRATEHIQDYFEGDFPLHIANPRRDTFDQARFNKREQLLWEKTHLRRAAGNGVLLFWLAAESEDAPVSNKPGRAYAQTTRIEFGRAVGWHDMRPGSIRISLGMEPGYVGSVDYYLDTAEEIGLPVSRTLEETCLRAVALIQGAKDGPI